MGNIKKVELTQEVKNATIYPEDKSRKGIFMDYDQVKENQKNIKSLQEKTQEIDKKTEKIDLSLIHTAETIKRVDENVNSVETKITNFLLSDKGATQKLQTLQENDVSLRRKLKELQGNVEENTVYKIQAQTSFAIFKWVFGLIGLTSVLDFIARMASIFS